MVPEILKWSPDLLQLCSRSVSGCTRGTLGPSFGIRTWFRVPSWAPRTTLGAKFGVEHLFFDNRPRTFEEKTNLKPFALRCFDFQCRWCEESFVGFPVIWIMSSCFFFGVGGSGRSPLECPTFEIQPPAPSPQPKCPTFEIRAGARAGAVGIAFLCTGPKDSRIWDTRGTSRVPGRLSEII